MRPPLQHSRIKPHRQIPHGRSIRVCFKWSPTNRRLFKAICVATAPQSHSLYFLRACLSVWFCVCLCVGRLHLHGKATSLQFVWRGDCFHDKEWRLLQVISLKYWTPAMSMDSISGWLCLQTMLKKQQRCIRFLFMTTQPVRYPAKRLVAEMQTSSHCVSFSWYKHILDMFH